MTQDNAGGFEPMSSSRGVRYSEMQTTIFNQPMRVLFANTVVVRNFVN
jgi:hypothetical protein